MKPHFNHMLDLTPVKNEVDQFLYDFQEVKITNQDQYTQAGDTVKQIQMKIKKIESKRLEYTRPLDESKRLIMDDFKKITEPLEEFVSELKNKMLAWYKLEQARLNEEQKKLEQEALAKAKAEHKAEVQVPVINNQLKTQRGDVATISIKKVWKYRIVDETKIPRQYLTLDTAKVTQAIRDEVRIIDGLEIYQEEQAPSIR